MLSQQLKLKAWIYNNPKSAKEIIGQFLKEKNYMISIGDFPSLLRVSIFSRGSNLVRNVTLKKELNYPPELTTKKILIDMFELYPDLEREFIDWIKLEFSSNENRYDIYKFDAVCAQEITKRAIDLMVDERKTRKLSIKIKEKIKKEAEKGGYKCLYFLPKNLPYEIIDNVIKDLEASWFFVKFHSPFNVLEISWKELNNED